MAKAKVPRVSTPSTAFGDRLISEERTGGFSTSCWSGKKKMKANAGAPRAFTLIELLIVVAIISILASIAVPNFVEAQTRARVARIYADMRTLVLGLESYMIDCNTYPVRYADGMVLPALGNQAAQMGCITSPIAYLSSLPPDIFAKGYQFPNNAIDYWDSRQVRQFVVTRWGRPLYNWAEEVPDLGWLLVSTGPDGVIGAPTRHYLDYPDQGEGHGTLFNIYDPTNGTITFGNIFRFQGDRNPVPILYQIP